MRNYVLTYNDGFIQIFRYYGRKLVNFTSKQHWSTFVSIVFPSFITL